MKVSPFATRTYDFACHSAACRPPTSGGTGGSGGGGRSVTVNRNRSKIKDPADYDGPGPPGPIDVRRGGNAYGFTTGVGGRVLVDKHKANGTIVRVKNPITKAWARRQFAKQVAALK